MYRNLKNILAFLLPLFLLGCPFHNHSSLVVINAGVIEITVSPNPIKIADGGDLQLSATATVITEQGEEVTLDITEDAKWQSLNTSIVYFDSSLAEGVLSSDYNGSSNTAQIIVIYDGVESDPVDVEVCQLNQDCLMQKIVDTSGVYITSSPSLAYFNGLASSPSYSSSVSDFSGGSSYGQFIAMTYLQASDWCAYLSSVELEGRNDWQLYEEDIYDALFATVGDFYAAFGWPTTYHYWTSDTGFALGDYITYDLDDGSQSDLADSSALYASCISFP